MENLGFSVHHWWDPPLVGEHRNWRWRTSEGPKKFQGLSMNGNLIDFVPETDLEMMAVVYDEDRYEVVAILD